MQKRVFTSQQANEEQVRLKEKTRGGFFVYRQSKWCIQKRLRSYDVLYVFNNGKWVKRVPCKEQKDDFALYL